MHRLAGSMPTVQCSTCSRKEVREFSQRRFSGQEPPNRQSSGPRNGRPGPRDGPGVRLKCNRWLGVTPPRPEAHAYCLAQEASALQFLHQAVRADQTSSKSIRGFLFDPPVQFLANPEGVRRGVSWACRGSVGGSTDYPRGFPAVSDHRAVITPWTRGKLLPSRRPGVFLAVGAAHLTARRSKVDPGWRERICVYSIMQHDTMDFLGRPSAKRYLEAGARNGIVRHQIKKGTESAALTPCPSA